MEIIIGDNILYKSKHMQKKCKGKVLDMNEQKAYILNPDLPTGEICNIEDIFAKLIK